MFEPFVVEGAGGELFFDFGETGEHPEDAVEGAEVLDHFHLIEEVGEVEFALLHPLGGFHGFLFVDFLGDGFDHGDDITHAEDTVGHAVGVELLEGVEVFSFTDVFDGEASDTAHGEGRTTTGVSVEFSQDDTG